MGDSAGGTQDRLTVVLPTWGSREQFPERQVPLGMGAERMGVGLQASWTHSRCPPGPTILGIVSRKPRGLGTGLAQAFPGGQP